MVSLIYERTSPKLVKVLADGTFAGFLAKGYRKPTTGLHAKGYTYWNGTIAGQEITATTITAAKAKLAKLTGDAA